MKIRMAKLIWAINESWVTLGESHFSVDLSSKTLRTFFSGRGYLVSKAGMRNLNPIWRLWTKLFRILRQRKEKQAEKKICSAIIWQTILNPRSIPCFKRAKQNLKSCSKINWTLLEISRPKNTTAWKPNALMPRWNNQTFLWSMVWSSIW